MDQNIKPTSTVWLKPLMVMYDAPFHSLVPQQALWEANLQASEANILSIAWQQSILLQRLRARFQVMSSLKQNWDSYESAPPGRDSLSTAEDLVTWAVGRLHQEFAYSDIAPSVEGGVAITFHSPSGARYAHLEILNNREPRLLLAEQGDLVELSRISISVEMMRDALEKASLFTSEPVL